MHRLISLPTRVTGIEFLSRRTLMIIAIALLTSACRNYSVSVNENVVYNPPGLLKDYYIKDENLRNCVKETIAENNLTRAEQLKVLECGPVNIASITGLSDFKGIVQLRLAGNRITNLEPLRGLVKLKQLDLGENEIRDISPLYELVNLSLLNLLGNDNLNCEQISKLPENTAVTVPAHCQP